MALKCDPPKFCGAALYRWKLVTEPENAASSALTEKKEAAVMFCGASIRQFSIKSRCDS